MGLSWFSAEASGGYSSSNYNQNSNTNSNYQGTSNTTGTQTNNQTGTVNGTQTGNVSGTSVYAPNLSDYWKNAYQSFAGAVGPGGATPTQQTAIDFVNNYLSNGGGRNAISGGNASLGGINNGLGNVGNWWENQLNNGSYTLGSLAAKAKAGVPGYESYAAPQDVSAPTIVSNDALSKIPQYSQFYDDSLINPSLKSYDYGTDRAFSALDARTAGGGGFANSRSGLAYSDLGTQSALGRGQLYSQLKNLGLTNAAGLATGDVNRMLSADTTNAGNSLAAQEFNANLRNNRQQFDVGAAYQGDQMRMNYAKGQEANLLSRAGISQQIIDNVVKADGINMDAAAALFQAGAITYGQLQSILQAAQAANGGTTTNNQNSTQNNSQTSTQTGTQTNDETTNTSGTGTSTTNTSGSSSGTNVKGGVKFLSF